MFSDQRPDFPIHKILFLAYVRDNDQAPATLHDLQALAIADVVFFRLFWACASLASKKSSHILMF